MNTFMKKRKAVSPVIATVILVAVAISVAVGVSYWMGGISAQYTQFEKIEVQTAYAQRAVDAGSVLQGWVISLTLKNSGSASATITHVFVNDVPVTLYAATGVAGATNPAEGANPIADGTTGTNIPATGLNLEAGEDDDTVEVYVSAEGGSLLSSGTTINIKLHSAGGMDYIKLVRLT